MSKYGLIFPFLKLLFTNRKDVLKNLYHFTKETRAKNAVVKNYGLSKGLPTVDILDLFPDFEEKIDNYTYLDGTSRAIDISVLKQFAKSIPGFRYIEFGTWRGESIRNVSDLGGECFSISFSDQEMLDWGFDQHCVNASRVFSSNVPNITNIKHNTHTYDFSKLKGTFDIVFVDADHQYEAVKKDTEIAFSLLKNKDSILVWHDYGKTYETHSWQVLAGMMDGAPDRARKKIYHISNCLCAVYLNRDIKSGFPDPYMPTKTFSIHIKANKFTK